MKVILCDKCKEMLKKKDRVIVASAVRYYIGENSEIYKGDGIGIEVLIGEHFCSVECLKESIQ